MAKRKSVVTLSNFVQMSAGVSGSNIVNVMENGSLQIGNPASKLVLHSNDDIAASIKGLSYSLITEKNAGDYITSGGLNKVTVFKANGTFIKDAKTKRIVVEVVGGGGAAPSCAALTILAISISGGGGSGAYLRALFDQTQTAALSAVPIIIGAGGVIAVGQGGSGGDTTFGTILVAKGGEGAKSIISTNLLGSYTMTNRSRGGLYVNVSTATIIQALKGMAGQEGCFIAADGRAGRGGSNPLGMGGQGMSNKDTLSAATDMIPDGFGAGAGGFVVTGTGSTNPGRAGCPGAVVVWEYY